MFHLETPTFQTQARFARRALYGRRRKKNRDLIGLRLEHPTTQKISRGFLGGFFEMGKMKVGEAGGI
jgi:hypothetical protein